MSNTRHGLFRECKLERGASEHGGARRAQLVADEPRNPGKGAARIVKYY
jgi:hypothetical protein